MNKEKKYNPFEGALICDCEKDRPEIINSVIPSAYDKDDEAYCYVCDWCRFIRKLGMADELESIKKNTTKPISKTDNSYNDCLEYGYNYVQNYEECANMRAFFGGIATHVREGLNLSISDVAAELNLPEYIISNLEKGEEDIKHKCSPFTYASVTPVMEVTCDKLTQENHYEREWWEDKNDIEIEAVIREFLLGERIKRG